MSQQLNDQELLARLVSFDTTSNRPTTPLFDFVCSYLEHSEIRCERFSNGAEYENVLFSTGPDPSGDDGLLLCGHVDTVPADEPDWISDPRTLTERDGSLFARGACDMKGFDALAINLFRRCSQEKMKQPLSLLLTHSEEVGTIGAGAFVQQWSADRPFPKNVIVGEPTSLKPIRGHKGHLAIRLTVGGQPCHTGYPHEGVNAIEAAIPLLEGLKGLRETLVGERTDTSVLFDETPFPVLTIVEVTGGEAINIMPEECVITLGVRLLPGQRADEFLPRVEKVISAAGLRSTKEPEVGGCVLESLNNTPSFGTPADDPFLAMVMDIAGVNEAGGVGYASDAGRLEALGCRSVIFGPGDISVAHKPNEWMPMDEFERAPDMLRALIERMS